MGSGGVSPRDPHQACHQPRTWQIKADHLTVLTPHRPWIMQNIAQSAGVVAVAVRLHEESFENGHSFYTVLHESHKEDAGMPKRTYSLVFEYLFGHTTVWGPSPCR